MTDDILAQAKLALRFYTINAEWPAMGDGTIVGTGDLRKMLRALVERCEDLMRQRESDAYLVESLKGDIESIRQRHAQEVEAAFREGYGEGVRWGAYLPGVTALPPSDEDAAWLASEAHRKVGT